MRESARSIASAACAAACLAWSGWVATPLAATTDPAAVQRDGRCDRCGGCTHVRPTCVHRLTQKKVTKVCWDYRCEQICIPGPSIARGADSHRDDCGCWTCWLWKPTCAEVITRRVPVKREVERTVPAVEWTVEERCSRCRHDPAAGSP